MLQQHNLSENQCFFCIEKNLQSCITRSLFHKHNRGVDKLYQIVTQLVQSNKQKTVQSGKSSQLRNRYEQIKHLIDTQQNMQNFMLFFSARLQLMDLLQYYKYRKYVPVFSGHPDNSCIAESIHSYYYDRLKLYYNEIKKKFNMTIESTFQQQLQSELNTKSDRSEKSQINNKSKILIEIANKNSTEMIKNTQSESKALNNLMKYLKNEQNYIKKIKKQKIVNDKQQQKNPIIKKNNFEKYLIQQNKLINKKNNNNNKYFIKYIQSINNNKIINKYKIKKKSIYQQFTKTIYTQKQKIRRKSQSLLRIKKQLSNNKLNIIDKQKIIINKQKNINFIHKSNKSLINYTTTLPYKKFIISKKQNKKQIINLPFNIKQNKSQSSLSKYNNNNNHINNNHINNNNNNNNNNNSHIVIHKSDHCKLNLKYLINKKSIECPKQYHTTRAENKQPLDEEKKKIIHTKTPIKNNHMQIDTHDNLPSINRKKLQQLKLKSQRKKQGRK